MLLGHRRRDLPERPYGHLARPLVPSQPSVLILRVAPEVQPKYSPALPAENGFSPGQAAKAKRLGRDHVPGGRGLVDGRAVRLPF
jgi:hypothetical protein